MARPTVRRRPRAPREDALGSLARAERLGDLATALRLARTAEDVMSVLVLEAERTFGAASAVAYLHRGATLEFAAAMGRAEDAHEWLRSVPLDAQIPVARAIREGRPCWFESRAALAAAFPGWAARVPHAERFGALAALPLRLGDVTLGAVGFAFDRERTFPPEERAVFAAAATEGAIALDRVRDAERVAPAEPSKVP